MAKKTFSLQDYIVYLLFRFILFVLRTIPAPVSRWFCVGIGELAYWLDKKHRELAKANLKMAFPEKSEDEILDILKKVFENLGATLFDFARIPKISKSNYKDYFDYEGTRFVDEELKKNRGVLFISAHLCCWEMLSAHCFLYESTSVLAKDLHNEYVNGYVKYVRGLNNVNFIPIRDSVRNVIKLLKDAGTIYTLLDQYAHEHEAVSADFFGRPAATQYFAALLALKLDITVIPVFVKRDGKYRYKICYKKPFDIIISGDRKQNISDNTQAFTKLIEDEIRKRPEDWIWMHNRWK